MKKRPVYVYKGAHTKVPAAAAVAATAAGGEEQVPPDGSWAVAGSDTASWVQSVAVCRGSDLVASGAGDGAVKLWAVEQGKGGAAALTSIGHLPATGFVNGLAVARSGRFVLAALGQEPRLGRWGRVATARSGLLLHQLELEEDS
jgi:ribosomal RNA-processing protein 9